MEFFKKVRYRDKTNATKSYYKHLNTLKVSDLRDQYSKIAPLLYDDGYFTVNSFDRPVVKDLEKRLYSIDEWHGIGQVSFLNACVADLDVGRHQSHDWTERQDWREALHQVYAMMAKNQLPQASIVSKSGRGINLLWLLHAVEYPNNISIIASPEQIGLYRKVNDEINRRLRYVAADKQANTVSKLLRVPGSMHTIANQKAKYAILKGINGTCISYTLYELAFFLNI